MQEKIDELEERVKKLEDLVVSAVTAFNLASMKEAMKGKSKEDFPKDFPFNFVKSCLNAGKKEG